MVVLSRSGRAFSIMGHVILIAPQIYEIGYVPELILHGRPLSTLLSPAHFAFI